MVDKVPLGHIFLRVLRFSPINIIPPMLEAHSFIYCRHQTTRISTTDNVVKQHALSYEPHSLDFSLRYRNSLTANYGQPPVLRAIKASTHWSILEGITLHTTTTSTEPAGDKSPYSGPLYQRLLAADNPSSSTVMYVNL